MYEEISPQKQSHPVYSDFSHMASQKNAEIGNLAFAVGLREENPEEMVSRILPLTRIIPSEKKVRVIKKTVVEKHVAAPVEDKICMRPDCVARRERYSELHSENEPLRQQLKAMEGKVAASKNKISLTEKSIQMAEDKNENFKGQIEDIQAKIFTLEAEVEKGDQSNQVLRNQLADLLQEIERLKAETQKNVNRLAVITQNNSGPSVVFSKSGKKACPQAFEVSVLQNDGDDSD